MLLENTSIEVTCTTYTDGREHEPWPVGQFILDRSDMSDLSEGSPLAEHFAEHIAIRDSMIADFARKAVENLIQMELDAMPPLWAFIPADPPRRRGGHRAHRARVALDGNTVVADDVPFTRDRYSLRCGVCRFTYLRQLEPLWAALDQQCADGVRRITLRDLAQTLIT